jgi:type IV secretion system protein VirB10
VSDDISGLSAKLKPWHFAVIGGACIASVMAIPALSHLLDKKKGVDTTAATMAANSTGGEPWHAPAFPDSPPPTPAPVIAAAPPPVPPAPVPENLVPNAPHTPFGRDSGGPGDYRMFGQNVSVPVAQGARVNSGPNVNSDETPVAASRVAAGGAREWSMGDLLKPTETTGYIASRIKHPWATIEQGRIISCNSVTPMTSQLPGFVKAKITYDVRSTDGTTTLIDRNSDIFGEIGHGLAAGQDRLFVLWRSVTTPAPDFVRITLNTNPPKESPIHGFR